MKLLFPSRSIIILLIVIFAVVSAEVYSLIDSPEIIARVDYSLGVVFLEKWRSAHYLGIDDVVPVNEYLDYSIKEAVISAWRDKAKQKMAERELTVEPSGLIPDIELPKLPLLGEGSKIDISGRDRITLGGSQTVIKGATQTSSNQNPFPELKMEQQLAVNVTGTVGDRTKIVIDHDSEREEQQNKIKLQYTGTEDEIVRSIELGDTRLDIPGTIYTGDLPARQGLFGISAKGKIGGVDVYAVASREGSQNQSQSFTGRRRVTTDTIWDVDFVQRRFYRLPGINPDDRLLNLKIYVDDKNSGNNQATAKAIATVFPDSPDSTIQDSTWWSYDRAGGDFDLKAPGIDYVLQPGNIIEFLSPVERNYIIGAIIYKDNDTIGGGSIRDSLILCLLKPEVSDSLSRVWDLQLRNCYQLPQGDIKIDTLRIFLYNPQGQHCDYEIDSLNPYFGQKFLELLGLDPNGDSRIEYPQFESKTGIIRFPDDKPFAANVLSVKNPLIYRLDPDILPPGVGRKYFLVVSYYTVTETYYLGQSDIIEKSERVVVNGQEKVRDVDYSIDYKTGVLTFLKPLPPDADIQVNFEYQPWISFSQKSLIGTRAEWTFVPNGKIGSSFFYRSEGSGEEKPALGSEPFQRTIAETDFSYNLASDALTAFLDGLPILSAQTPSRFDIKSEGAISLPNPNTRGVVYLDDFEGTTITREVYNTALLWSPASVPVGKDTASFARVPLYWTTPSTKVRKDSVFGPSIGDEGREVQEILRVVFTPDSENQDCWAGLMQALPGGQIGMNFTDIDNLEIIMRSQRNSGNLHVSMGMTVDEDAPRRDRNGKIRGYNGICDTEDKNGNGVLEEWEDTGLDTVPGIDSLWMPYSSDDGNDDYNSETNQQGTEGNRRLDTEDIDRNGFSRYNHYFEYNISLDDSRFVVPLFNNWRLFRINLRDTTIIKKVGNPKWEDIRVVRLWFDGFETADTLEIYSLQFIGSKWRNPKILDQQENTVIPTDTTEKVWATQISKKNDTTYNSPFELKRDITTGSLENEAALALNYQSLESGHQAVIAKTIVTGEDYRDYEDMRLYIHDDGNDVNWFIRFGADSANYYEFRAQVKTGRKITKGDGKWYEFVFHLDSFPSLKARRDSSGIPAESIFSQIHGDFCYRVKGFPSMANIRWTALGIENRNQQKITGAIWFNDIRLTEPRREVGYGFTAQTNIQLADFISCGLRWAYSDPNFRRFSEGGGVKTGGFTRSIGTDIRVNIDRLLPRDWKISLPFSYTVFRQTSFPKFSSRYPDLRFSRNEAALQPTVGHSQEMGINNITKQKSSNKFLNYTIESMTLSWRERWASNYLYPFFDSTQARNWQWNYNIAPDFKISLGEDKEIYPFPRDIRIGVAGNKGTTIRADTIRTDTLRNNGIAGDFNVAFSPLEDLTVDYGWESERDMLTSNPDSVFMWAVGKEASRNENFGISYDMEIGDILNPSIEFEGDYTYERPKAANAYLDYRNLTNSGEIGLSATVELAELIDKLIQKLNITQGGKRDTLSSQKRQITHRLENPELLESLPQNPESLSSPETKVTRTRRSVVNLRGISSEIIKRVEPLEVAYTVSRSSDYLGFKGVVPWYYRLGFNDTIPIDTSQGIVNRTRELNTNFRLSSGISYKDIALQWNYEFFQGKNRIFLGANFDRNVVWPNIQIDINRVHSLFSKLATDSRLSTSYRQTHSLRGQLVPVEQKKETLALFGRVENRTVDFNPLLSWQTSWKKRVSTTLTLNYNLTTTTTYLSETGRNRSQSDSRSRGGNFSLSYAFSAPQGLKLPFLRKVRFSSDFSLSWQLRYSQNLRQQTVWTELNEATTVPHQRDNVIATTLGGSYRFSRTIEAGFNTGYSYTKAITGITNQRTDLNIWVLFRF